MSYIVGYNMSGYMPDNEPYEADSFEHAKQCLISEIQFTADSLEDEDTAADYDAAVEYVESWTEPNGITIGGYHYWIAEE